MAGLLRDGRRPPGGADETQQAPGAGASDGGRVARPISPPRPRPALQPSSHGFQPLQRRRDR